MKTSIIVLLFLIIAMASKAQEKEFNHFEVDVSALFWSPLSAHMQMNNSVTSMSMPDGSSYSYGGLSGYGYSIGPALSLNYFFSNNIGLTFGFYHLEMDNELNFNPSDSTFRGYENQASIDHIILGFINRIPLNEKNSLYVGIGANIMASYDLEQKYSDENGSKDDFEANDSGLGIFAKAEIKMQVVKFVHLNLGVDYSFIPIELEYSNNDGSLRSSVKTNLGGIAAHVGLSFIF